MKIIRQRVLSNKTMAYNGAMIGIAAVFVYSLIIMGYTITRSSVAIGGIMHGKEKYTILWANGLSIAYSVAVFSVLMSLVSLVWGALMSVILQHSLMYFNPECSSRKALFITGITALLILAVIYLLLYILLKDWMTFQYIEPLLFWFLFPAILCLAAFLVGGVYLNRDLRNRTKHAFTA
jgi:hypothetical protein